MANMTVAAANVALKQLVASELVQQYEDETNVSMLIKRAEDVEFLPGKGFRIGAKFNPPTGHVRGGEGLAFRASGLWKLADMYVHSVQYGFPGEITGRMIRNFKSASSLVKGMSDWMAHYKAAMMKDKERGVFVDNNATRAFVSSTTGLTITMTTAAAATPNQTKGAVWLDLGESYDVISSAGVNRGSFTVTQDDPVTITVNAVPSGTTGGDRIVHTSSYLNHETGLPAIINNDTGVIQMLSRATNPKAKSIVLDLNGASITVATITKAKALAKARRGTKSKEPVLAVMPVGQKEILLRLGHNLVQYNPNDKEFGTKFDSFAVGATVAHEAVDCCEDRIYFPDLEMLRWYPEKEPGPYDDDGNLLRMKVASGNGSDAYYLAWGWAGNYGSKRFDCHILIKRAAIGDAATQVAANQ